MRLRAVFSLVALTVSISAMAISCRQSTQDRDCVPRVPLRLVLASGQGNVEEMAAAIKDGADVNASDSLLGAPVVAAASSGNQQAVKLLVEKGANVNGTDNQGYTALMKGTLAGNIDIVRLLLS